MAREDCVRCLLENEDAAISSSTLQRNLRSILSASWDHENLISSVFRANYLVSSPVQFLHRHFYFNRKRSLLLLFRLLSGSPQIFQNFL
mmetsp:Transcript_15801/g.52867  ORF Transcript_15801/g.52867 Transcript_15801/m.52867 type:complete len:89 (+) Transcript_15801:269-535(+)